MRADASRAFLFGFFHEPWKDAFEGRPRTATMTIEDAAILLMDDKPSEVDTAIARFLEGEVPRAK